jgi:hypothetical protein
MVPNYASFYEIFKSNQDTRVEKKHREEYSDIKKALDKYYKTEENLRQELIELKNQIKQYSKDVILFVEGKTDKIILENAWTKLYPATQMSFLV